MKTRFFVCTCALVFGLAVVAIANDEGDQYDAMFMKPAIAANMALQKDVMGGDMGMAAADAGTLQAAFAKVEGYWAKKGGADDAVGFAKAVEKSAGDVKSAATAGDKDAAAAAAKTIAAGCGGCHMAHRVRLPAGGFDLK
jgi:cytochrome c556